MPFSLQLRANPIRQHVEVVSKPAIRFNVKAEPWIQAQEYISILSIKSPAPTPKAENRLDLREGFETTSKQSVSHGCYTLFSAAGLMLKQFTPYLKCNHSIFQVIVNYTDVWKTTSFDLSKRHPLSGGLGMGWNNLA